MSLNLQVRTSVCESVSWSSCFRRVAGLAEYADCPAGNMMLISEEKNHSKLNMETYETWQ